MLGASAQFVGILILGSCLSVALSGKSAREKANELEHRYKSREKCMNSNGRAKPAYECTGIILRGIAKKTLSSPWNLKKGNKKRESFSAAFLSSEAQWTKFPYKHASGFIIYPHLRTPPRQRVPDVFCAFPIDGFTIFRGDHGCGPPRKYFRGPEGGSCHKQGIRTFEDWRKHFKRQRNLLIRHLFKPRQCSFDMSGSSAADRFRVLLDAMKYMRDHHGYRYKNNELLFHAWDEDDPKKLPIEAFFYLVKKKGKDSQAKQQARKFRDEYEDITGKKLPIVGLQLPSKKQKFRAYPYE